MSSSIWFALAVIAAVVALLASGLKFGFRLTWLNWAAMGTGAALFAGGLMSGFSAAWLGIAATSIVASLIVAGLVLGLNSKWLAVTATTTVAAVVVAGLVMDFGPIWLAVATIAIVALLLTAGLVLGVHVIKEAISEIESPRAIAYTILIARFPDPLILQFGNEQHLLELPRGVRLAFMSWGDGLTRLIGDHSRIAYTNRHTAIIAAETHREVLLRPRVLCTYQGFSICLADPAVTPGQSTPPGNPASNRKILVLEGTDQHRALVRYLKNELGIVDDLKNHIEAIGPNEDILERALQAKSESKSDVIGFAAGITERLVAEKLGYSVFAEQPAVLGDLVEENSFAYIRPKTPREKKEISYLLEQIEALWDVTVSDIKGNSIIREDFRKFLNEELANKLGDLARSALEAQSAEIFDAEDMEKLLSRWLQFPESGR